MARTPELELSNPEAERAVLGSILINPDGLAEVAAVLQPDDFHLAANGHIYAATLRLWQTQRPVDLITLEAELRTEGSLQKVGDGRETGVTYLMGLFTATPNSLHGLSYAQLVAELAERRRLLAAARQLAQLTLDQGESIQLLRERAHGLVLEAVGRAGSAVKSSHEAVLDYLDTMTERLANPRDFAGLTTGFYDLDNLTNGLEPTQLIVLAGRPGMGKTALQVAIADQMAQSGLVGLFFSLEMSRDQLLGRLVSRTIGVPGPRLSRGALSVEETGLFYEAVGQLAEMPLFIDDTAALSAAEMRARAMRVKALAGLDYIMVDYLQLMSTPGFKNPYESISAAARDLKDLAKALDVPVLAASQLNRDVEKRQDKRPTMGDLRDSGQIEEAANKVLLLYRDSYYNGDASTAPRVAELDLAKNREGPTGQVCLYWDDTLGTFRNLVRKRVALG